jgi:hypothetical protein
VGAHTYWPRCIRTKDQLVNEVLGAFHDPTLRNLWMLAAATHFSLIAFDVVKVLIQMF